MWLVGAGTLLLQESLRYLEHVAAISIDNLAITGGLAPCLGTPAFVERRIRQTAYADRCLSFYRCWIGAVACLDAVRCRSLPVDAGSQRLETQDSLVETGIFDDAFVEFFADCPVVLFLSERDIRA